MQALWTILRISMLTIMAVAYLAMSFGSVTHELSHWTERSSVASAASGGSVTAIAQPSTDHVIGGVDSGWCFFCLHNSSVLQILAFALLVGVPIVRRTYASTIPDRPILAPIASTISLRAPPVFA